MLQRQFEELSRGLSDDAPAVRITAAGGTCSLLNVYWELVPAGVTAAYLKRLTGKGVPATSTVVLQLHQQRQPKTSTASTNCIYSVNQ